MQAFGDALRCLGSISGSSLVFSEASLESGCSWTSTESVESGPADSQACELTDCYTVDLLEDSPSHAFLVRASDKHRSSPGGKGEARTPHPTLALVAAIADAPSHAPKTWHHLAC